MVKNKNSKSVKDIKDMQGVIIPKDTKDTEIEDDTKDNFDIKEIQNEIQMGLDYMRNKRIIFRDRLDKYVEQDKQGDKIGINTIYAMMQLGLAIRFSDTVSTIISPRKFGDEEYAYNLTSLAEFDYDEMERSIAEYQLGWDEQFFGYSIERNRGWDDIRQVPLTSIEDPITWIPDPYGDFRNPFRFHYFEVEMLKSSMTEDKGFDMEKVEALTNERGTEIQANKTYRDKAAGFNSNVEDLAEDYYVNVYDGVRTDDEGKLFLVTVDLNTQEVLRTIEVQPVTKEEKESGIVDMRTQVNVTWFSPKRGDVCGVSLLDLTEDKQKMQSLLANLRMTDAKFSTFGQMNLVNTDLVKNTGDLLTPSTKTKWIGVNAGGQNLSNAVYPVPRQSIMQDSYNMSNELQNQLHLDTGMDSNTLGVGQGAGKTLGESQQIQANANIRLALGIGITNIGREAFWRYIWLRSYYEYFDKDDKKFIRVAKGFDSLPIEFRQDDFLGIESPEIKIVSKKVAEGLRAKEKTAFLTMLPYFLQDPTTAKVIKRIALRYALTLQGLPREKVKLLTYDKDEEAAKHKLILINNKDERGIEIDDISEDHQTFLVIFESAIDSDIKDRAIQARKDAYVTSGQAEQQQQASLDNTGGGMINSMQNQMTSNMISQDNNQNNKNIGNIAQSV